MGNLLTADPAAPGKSLITSIPITSGQIAGTNTVTGAAVVGVTSSAGAGDSREVVAAAFGHQLKSDQMKSSNPTSLNPS